MTRSSRVEAIHTTVSILGEALVASPVNERAPIRRQKRSQLLELNGLLIDYRQFDKYYM